MTALGAMLTALGVVVIYLGAVTDVLDLSMCALASFICVFALLEFGTGYTRATYYYSDIILCREEADIITIITDTAAMPFSIQKSSVSKGSYDEFSFILRRVLGGKYQYMGGKV